MSHEEKIDFILRQLRADYSDMTAIEGIEFKAFKPLSTEEVSDIIIFLINKGFVHERDYQLKGSYGVLMPIITAQGKHFLKTTGGFDAIRKREEKQFNAVINTDSKTFWILIITIIGVVIATITLIHELCGSGH